MDELQRIKQLSGIAEADSSASGYVIVFVNDVTVKREVDGHFITSPQTRTKQLTFQAKRGDVFRGYPKHQWNDTDKGDILSSANVTHAKVFRTPGAAKGATKRIVEYIPEIKLEDLEIYEVQLQLGKKIG